VPLGHKPADMAMRCIPKVAYKSHGSMAWLQYDLAAARAVERNTASTPGSAATSTRR